MICCGILSFHDNLHIQAVVDYKCMTSGTMLFETHQSHPDNDEPAVGIIAVGCGILFLYTILLNLLFHGGLNSKWDMLVIPSVIAFPLLAGIMRILSIDTKCDIEVYEDRIILKGTYVSLAVDSIPNISSPLQILKCSLIKQVFTLRFDDMKMIIPNFTFSCPSYSPNMINYFEIKMKNGDRYSVMFRERDNPLPILREHAPVFDIEQRPWSEIKEHLITDPQHLPRYIYYKLASLQLKQLEFDDHSANCILHMFATIFIVGTVFALLDWVDIVSFFIAYGIISMVFFVDSVSTLYRGRFACGFSDRTVKRIVEIERKKGEIIVPYDFLAKDPVVKELVIKERVEQGLLFPM